MVVFHCDLDNTLIYSYKHPIEEKKKCVEVYQGREISFMTEKSNELLKQICKRILFVPTTTRTIEQYKRINLGIDEPEYAFVCNGGILLKNGKSDNTWYKESLNLISDCKMELKNAESMLERDKNRCFELRNIEELFLFTKSSFPCKTVELLKQNLNTDLVDVCSNGTKIYVIPKKLTKGNAVRRFKEKMNSELVISAGDSEFDLSMLEEADLGIAPHQLGRLSILDEKIITLSQLQIFSDELLSYIIERLEV